MVIQTFPYNLSLNRYYRQTQITTIKGYHNRQVTILLSLKGFLFLSEKPTI